MILNLQNFRLFFVIPQALRLYNTGPWEKDKNFRLATNPFSPVINCQGPPSPQTLGTQHRDILVPELWS